MKNAKVHFIKLKMKSGEILELLRYPTHNTKLPKLPIHNTGILHIALQVQNIEKTYLKLKKPPINRNFLIEVRKDFDSRPKSKIKDSMFLNLPTMKKFETQFPTNVSLDNQIRTIRRGIKEVEITMNNVSNGKFP